MSKKIFLRVVLILALVGVCGYKWMTRPRPLMERLVSFQDETRNLAFSEITKLSEAERATLVTKLLEQPLSPDPKARQFTLFAIRKLGGSKLQAFPYFLTALSDSDPGVQEEARVSLVNYGEDALPNLFRVLEGENKTLRAPIVEIIAKSGDKSLPGWQNVFQSKDPELRLMAAEKLAEKNVLPKDAAPILKRDMLAAKDSFTDSTAARPRLARLLEKIDVRRRELIDLGFDLKQPDVAIRYRAAFVLSEINPPKVGAMEMLVGALADRDANVQARSLLALSRMGFEKTDRIRKDAAPRIKQAYEQSSKVIEGVTETIKLP